MNPTELNDLLHRHRRDERRQTLAAIIDACEPLVRSVCRRHLRDAHDAEDAVQETLSRLALRWDEIESDLTGWVCRVARSVCVDTIRRQARRRRRLHEFADLPRHDDDVLTRESALRRLDAALEHLDPATRRLVVERFLHGRKLHELVPQQRASVAQISRRIQRALAELTEAYRLLGLHADDADHVADTLAENGLHHGLRLARSWPTPDATHPAPADHPGPAGWPRPIRVGVLVSHTSAIAINHVGTAISLEAQLIGCSLLADPRFDVVALVEPRTHHIGHIERAMRDFDLTGGLIEATDTDALRTLDVIWLGWSLRARPEVTRAVLSVVNEGVGLYKQGAAGGLTCDHTGDNPVLLAKAFYGGYCTAYQYGRHHVHLPATIQRSHPALPGLSRGDQLPLDSCICVYEPLEDTEVLLVSDGRVVPTCRCGFCRTVDHTEALIPRPLPMIMSGRIGRGRAFVVQPTHPQALYDDARLTGGFMENVLTWLAEPRRPEGTANSGILDAAASGDQRRDDGRDGGRHPGGDA